MIYFITGVPGGGKSAFGVNLIYEAFINEKSKSFGAFDFCYTNINGFKIDDERLKGRVGWLNFDVVLAFATLDYDVLQLNKHIQNYDDEFIKLLELIERSEYPENSTLILPYDFQRRFEFLKGHRFKKCLFIVDEAHNFFNRKNQNLIRWLTYHRHFYQDVCLITQDLALVEKSYMTPSITDSYYKAFNPRFRLFANQLRYERNSSPKFYQKTKLEIITIKADPKIFELYTSGEARKVTPFYVKLAGIAVVLIIVVIIALQNVFNDESEKPVPSLPAGASTPPPPPPPSQPNFSSIEDKKPICLICNLESCSYHSKTVPIELITLFVEDGTLKPIQTYQHRRFKRFCFLAPSNFLGTSPPPRLDFQNDSSMFNFLGGSGSGGSGGAFK